MTISPLLRSMTAASVAAIALSACAAPSPEGQHSSASNAAPNTVTESPLSAGQVFTTYNHRAIDLEPGKLTHLVFMDIWDIYAGQGIEQNVAQLPADFLESSQQIWVQPHINVTRAQMAEFQQYYPAVQPLVLDRGYQLMRQNNAWSRPYHVLLDDGKPVFSGTTHALYRHLSVPETSSAASHTPANAAIENVNSLLSGNAPTRYKRPEVGEAAPVFHATTLDNRVFSLAQWAKSSNPVNLIFLDSLCPIPHLPGCEATIKDLVHDIESNPQQHWLGVVNSFYVDASAVTAFANKHQLKIPLIFDEGNRIFHQYGVSATPYTVVLNQTEQGQFRVAKRGMSEVD